MADATKARQLLAAKKMLKDYKKTKKSKSSETQNFGDTKTPTESLSNSTHSSLNEPPIAVVNNETNQSTSPLQNYFTSEIQPSNFFDSISEDEIRASNGFNAFNKVNFSENSNDFGFEKYTANNLDDIKAMEDPEINPNEIYDRLHQSESIECVNRLEHTQDILNSTVSVGNVNLDDDSSKIIQPVCVEKNEGNMETLKQLSTQIIQLIDDNVPQRKLEPTDKADDLFSLLEGEKKINQHLQLQVQDYENQILQLKNVSEAQKEYADRCTEEIKKLHEKLESHQQLVNILVGEKWELSNLAQKNQSLAREKTTECDELNARLKTSRSRVVNLEKELNTLRDEKSKYDKKGLEQNEENVNLMNQFKILKDQREETLQDISELQEKLHASTTENLKLQHEVQDLTSQLSLLNIKIQQLSIAGSSQFDNQVDSLVQQAKEYENQILKLNNVIKTLNNEKDHASSQYQQYVQQLNGQLSNLAQKLETKMHENESLIVREQQLTKQMGDLENLLQKFQHEQELSNKKIGNESKGNLEEALHSLQSLEQEKAILEENYKQVILERDELFRELESKKENINELEELVQQVRNDLPDNVKLLATMESDKVAAARAVAQNAELKKQLEEMQEVFIKMSNDKLELTEKLNREEHKHKDVYDKLNQFESQIHTLTDAIEIKDREMVTLRESGAQLNKYMLQQNQLEDRLRHYEAHDHSTHALQHELQESYKRIQHLKIENEKLRTSIENMNKMKNKDFDSVRVPEQTEKKSQIEEVQKVDNNELVNSNPNQVIDDTENVLSKEIAMLQLQEKFTKTMQDIANLQDEKQKLEHLVLQLQDETETIGEYVTLYQHQRGILKQRALEREEQMEQLTLDRQQMKNKLDKLNELVKTLVFEKGITVPEYLEQQSLNNHVLCDEHAKIHQDLNATRQNGTHKSLEDNNNSKTAERIIELLGEIKTSNLVQPCNTSETFHPCPWCSGQLITV